MILKPQEEIQLLLQHLKEAGYHLAIATGRPRTETIIPFESLDLNHILMMNTLLLPVRC